MARSLAVLHLLVTLLFIGPCHSRVYAQEKDTTVFGNKNITAFLRVQGGRLTIASISDDATGASLKLGEAFVFRLQDGREIRSSAMQITRGLRDFDNLCR